MPYMVYSPRIPLGFGVLEDFILIPEVLLSVRISGKNCLKLLRLWKRDSTYMVQFIFSRSWFEHDDNIVKLRNFCTLVKEEGFEYRDVCVTDRPVPSDCGPSEIDSMVSIDRKYYYLHLLSI
jgi:hypothetical protein